MSMHVLPMLFFNLGGEMLYVLDQRLRAQSVPLLKGKKVMADIVTTMFSENFVDDLFKPQPVYSRHALRTMFDRLVHSSIMRVDADSMDKLYDLMVMTFKYQIIKCKNPQDLLHVTLNHFDAILQFVASSAEARELVVKAFQKTVKMYKDMPVGELVMVRQSLLIFFHDSKNKVSIFVNSKSQNHDGTFVIPKSGVLPRFTDVPGKIFYFQKGRDASTFVTGANFSSEKFCESSTEIGGVRATKLGTNLYANGYSYEQLCHQDSYQTLNQNLAKEELNLLSHLVGANKDEKKECFKLNLFGLDNEQAATATGPAVPTTSSENVITIKAVKTGHNELSKIMQDFDISSNADAVSSDDLLSLMDNV